MLKEQFASTRACVSKPGLFASCMAGAMFMYISMLLSAPNAVAQSTTVEFNIPAQPISSALRVYAHQAKVQLLVLTEGLNTIQANAVVGRLDPRTALQMLLAGTGLQAEYRPDATVAVGRGSDLVGQATSASRYSRRGRASLLGQARSEATGEAVMMAQAAEDQNSTSRRTQSDSGEGNTDEGKLPIEEIIVTGTNIRGLAPESSPVRTFTRKDILATGAATAQDFIQTLSANFGGGSNPSIPGGLPNDNTGGGNTTNFGSFGSSVNLRGLGSGSTLVLINGHRLAPASVRGDFVDISMIPASAIERVETLTDGASSIYGSDAIAGVLNFILRDDFDGVETSLRYGTGTQNGTPDQYRVSVTGGQGWESGHALLVYEFFDQDHLPVEDRRFTQKDILPNFILPSQKRHSALVSLSQGVTSKLDLFADATYSKRNARQIRLAFDAPAVYEANASSESVTVSGGGTLKISRDWFLDFTGTYSTIDTRNDADLEIIPILSLETLRLTDSTLWTADANASGSLVGLPGGEVKLALGGHYRHESFSSGLVSAVLGDRVESEATRDVYAVFGEAFIPIVGPDNAVSGIKRLELNASGRFADYSDFGTTANSKVGVLWSPFDGLSFRGSYSTSFKAPPIGRVGESDFSASALRTSSINDRFGLTPADPSIADVVVLTVGGTATDLEAETSRAFTAGFDFNREWGEHGLAFSATWFDIDFSGRLGETPIPGNVIGFDAVNIAFDNPDLFPDGSVVFSPTMEEISNLLDSVDRFQNPDGLDPFDARVINFTGMVRNLSRTLVSGYDFDLAYTYDLNHGSLQLGVTGTFLQDLKQQAASTTLLVEQLDTLFNPVDLKWRGRAGYSNDSVSANVFVNCVDSYYVDNTANAVPIDSWTTVDVNLSFSATEHIEGSMLGNTVLRLSVINMFDDDPPLVPRIATFNVDGFDPTNASPLGRFISLEIAKRW